MELAGLAQGTPTTRVRRLAYAHVRSTASRQWAFVLEPWDSPPAWFDVPLVDLQPEVHKVATHALDASLSSEPDAPPELLLERAFAAAGEAVRGLSTSDRGPLFAGCGAFAAGVLCTASGLAFGWVGTSRVYRWRGESLEQLSRDHTLGAEAGAEAALPEALREVVSRQLVGATAEVRSIELGVGEAVVLASSDLKGLLVRPPALSSVDPVQSVAAQLLRDWKGPGIGAVAIARR